MYRKLALINCFQAKELVTDFSFPSHLQSLTLNGQTVQRTDVTKYLSACSRWLQTMLQCPFSSLLMQKCPEQIIHTSQTSLLRRKLILQQLHWESAEFLISFLVWQSERQEFKQTQDDCAALSEDYWHTVSQSRHHLHHIPWCRKILLDDCPDLAQYFFEMPSEKIFKVPLVKTQRFRSSFIPSAIHHLDSAKVWRQCCEDHRSLIDATVCAVSYTHLRAHETA